MKRIIYLIILITIVLTASGCRQETGTNKSVKLETQESNPINTTTYSDRIKNATLLIVVESIQSSDISLGLDMGTLVQYQGENYLVTHNHYGDMLQDMNILELRDAENHMIRTMYGSEFKSLIVYQDPGTLVLRAPDGLTDALTPVTLEHQSQLHPGDSVQVAYRGGSKRDNVEILDAVVEEIGIHGVTPIYQLRFSDGQLLSPGDSGGGVWYDGNFVGNNWSIIVTQKIQESSGVSNPTTETQTDLSYAAIFPNMFQ